MVYFGAVWSSAFESSELQEVEPPSYLTTEVRRVPVAKTFGVEAAPRVFPKTNQEFVLMLQQCQDSMDTRLSEICRTRCHMVENILSIEPPPMPPAPSTLPRLAWVC